MMMRYKLPVTGTRSMEDAYSLVLIHSFIALITGYYYFYY